MHIYTNGEFGYEMIVVIPYAYYLHKQKLLTKTTSSKDTKVFYYFSSNHDEKYSNRVPCLGTHNIKDASFSHLHTSDPNLSRWEYPPYKQIFKNNIFVYNKPLLIISNKRYTNIIKHNCGSFNDEQLDYIFNYFKDRYQIIYNRAKQNKIVVDTQIPNDQDTDFELLKKYPNIIDINKLHDLNPHFTFNTLQCMLHANCDNFISVQGGSSILSSSFGGKNLIYATCGEEIRINSYKNWYNKLSGCDVNYATDFNGFINKLNIF